MKKCPFCAEEIQDEAIKCKHCGSDLEKTVSKIPDPVIKMADVKERVKQEGVKDGDRVGLKVLGVFVGGFLSLAFWYIAIPAFVIWYLYKKDKRLSPKAKIGVSVVVSVIFLILGVVYLHEGRGPSLSIVSPNDGFTIQATSTVVSGTVDPSDATLTVNGIPLLVSKDGTFSYLAPLESESNQFTFQAKNKSKSKDEIITINRSFTQEEIEQRKLAAEQSALAKEAQRVSAIKEKLQREIYSIDNGIDMTQYRDDVLALQLEVALFNVWATMIREHQADKNEEIAALVAELERKVSALQSKEFPILRKNYTETLATKMWENNIDVESLGGSHKTIQFTGAVFANNANKAEIQQTVGDVLKQFRFTRVNYKWYEYDDEYTYYEIESLSDGDVAVIE